MRFHVRKYQEMYTNMFTQDVSRNDTECLQNTLLVHFAKVHEQASEEIL